MFRDIAAKSMIINMSRTIAAGIQMGAKTHHQLQSITFVSLRTMNTIVKSPVKPMPPVEADDDTFDILNCFKKFFK